MIIILRNIIMITTVMIIIMIINMVINMIIIRIITTIIKLYLFAGGGGRGGSIFLQIPERSLEKTRFFEIRGGSV